MNPFSQPPEAGQDRVLAGDIGGTKVRLGVFSANGSRLIPHRVETHLVDRYSSFEQVLETFMTGEAESLDRCCLGVAGPVVRGKCFTTNLPWVISENDIRKRFGLSRVRLVNDLVAMADSLDVLEEDDIWVINRGIEQPQASRGLIAAGTGLGEAYLFWNGAGYTALPSEGGHADFAPNNPLQAELWHYLHKRFGHVSLERILSGPGLLNVYRFLKDTRKAPELDRVARRLEQESPAQVISEAALAKECALCQAALDIFTYVYGAEAGNLALRGFCLGGVYLGGGIAPKILDKLKEPLFMKAFVAKGRLTSFLSKVPVKIILNDRAALYGAAARALTL